MDTFYSWAETMLTWCDDCGGDRDEEGQMRECPDCCSNMCHKCSTDHIKWCSDVTTELTESFTKDTLF